MEGSTQDGGSGVGNVIGEGLTARARSRDRPSSRDSNTTCENAASIRGVAVERENGDVLREKPVNGPRDNARWIQEDHRAKFYEHYHKEAEEYDKEFMKKHEEDLNTTLIFAGLFSAVTSAFIAQVQQALKPDPNEETAALLRVLIYKIDNTTFSGAAPALPQWTGPPQTTVRVQCLLYASLSASLLSAFLAMLGKQWLNRYASVGMRGSAIERSQDRQRKLDGIVVWYFDHVMESLPLMLQAALLLLGYALSRYLWEFNATIASVVLGVTSFGALFYLFIVVAGAASESCPYQTPWTSIVRRTVGLFRSVYVMFVERSYLYGKSVRWWSGIARRSAVQIITRILMYPFALLIAFTIDTLLLGRAILRPLVDFASRARGWLFRTTPIPVQGPNDQAAKLDFRCISWMLRTSLDKIINLSTLKHLETILTLPDLDPTVVMDCFDVFTNCIVVDNRLVVTVSRGSEQLAGISAACLLRALSRFSSAESTSTVIRDVLRRYKEVFPPHVNLYCLPCPKVMKVINPLFALPRERVSFTWRHYRPSTDELVPFARAMAQLAQVECCRREGEKPEILHWLVGFALRFLSRDPLPPTSVVVDCLTIVATDLGCNIPDTGAVAPDENARLEELFGLIIREYEGITSEDQRIPVSKCNAMIAFLPYAAQRKGNGTGKPSDTSFRTTKFSPSLPISHRVFKPDAQFVEAVLPSSLKHAALDAFRNERRFMKHASDIGTMIRLWITTAAALQYTDDVGRTVVDTLLRMALDDELASHIPALAWDWLKKRPLLLPGCRGPAGIQKDVVLKVGMFGDLELITSYLFVVWSEWRHLYPCDCAAMLRVIREELGGGEAAGHRSDLIQRLDYILSRLQPSSSPTDIWNKCRYEDLRTALLRVGGGAKRH